MSSVLLELADNLTDRRGAVLRIDGYNLPWLSVSTQPTGLLGIRFGPPVEAVAVRLGAGLVLAVHRSGEAMVIGSTDPSRAACADDASLVLDLARRSLGLPTAAPDRPVGELATAVWLDRALQATLDAPLGDPPGWVALARLHPAASGVATSPELLRHRTSAAPSWMQLRSDLTAGRAHWPPVSAALAQWFDTGALARFAFAQLPETDTMLADLADLLRRDDLMRLHAAITR